ncbi:MAG: sulfur carrier protein ThiS [Nannocystaceae bacterium]
MPQIVLNGRPHALPTEATIAGLLHELSLESGHVAVELNREIVPRAQHDATPLKDGDRLEIVTFVGGG